MSTNQVYDRGDVLTEPVASGTTSGAPVVVGQMPGVAETDRAADGTATVRFNGVYNLSVKGIDGSGNHAVAYGDILYFTTGDTPPLSVKATGVRYGYARGTVNSGGTSTIPVKVGY
jgi:predicted RecA/RadA family phage recombinase